MDTGSLALEGVGGVNGGQVLEVVGAYGSDSTGEVALLLYTITDDDGLLKELVVLFKSEINYGTSGNCDCLGRVTDAGNRDAGLSGYIEGISTVNVGHGSEGGVAHHHDGSTHDGVSILIDYLSGKRPVLGERCEAHEQDSQNDSRPL